MPPALMITPCTSVRFQYSRHQGISYCSGSFSVILVWPHRYVRRYQWVLAPAFGCANKSAGNAAAMPNCRKLRRVLSMLVSPMYQPSPAALSAAPAPRRFASFISEYLRESSTPSAPARSAAATASRVPVGDDLLCVTPVGI